MEIATLPPNTIVPEVLKKNNYERWSILIRHYLVAQDVWDVVDPNQTTEEMNERVRIKKNALALHAIKISCGAKAFDLIKNIESARYAWKALDMLNVPVYHDIRRRYEFMFTDEERELQRLLHDCIYDGSKSGVEDFFNLYPESGSDPRVLKYALHVAIAAGQEDIARFFYELNYLQTFSCEDRFILLEECITKKMFKIALDLLGRFPELATNEPPQGYMPIILTLAKTPPPFLRGSQLKFVRLWIYRCMVVNVDLIKPSNAAHDASGEELSCYQSCLQFLKALICKSVTTLSKILAKQTYHLKLTDVYARKVVSFLCEKLRGLEHNQFLQNGAVEAIFEAIKNGIPEIAIEIADTKDVLWASTDPVFAYAIAHRQEEVAKYLYKYKYKYKTHKFYDTDEDENNNLHLAAKLAPPLQLDRISGAALQLQSELRWFKSVEAIVPRFYTEQKNKYGERPYEVFVKEHKNLFKEAEAWMKKTAESSTVVAALIITIMFAAAFTVPGGNDQNTGFPIFLNTTAPVESFTVTPFKVFIISDAISLFTAASSVLIFLGIHTSRYAYEDFLKSLPMKLNFAFSFLLISIATMTVAFCATLYVMLRGQQKEIIPITVLAGILIICLGLMQFPLLLENIALTLRPDIFDRKTATAQLVELLGDVPILSFVVDVVIAIKDRLKISYLRCRNRWS